MRMIVTLKSYTDYYLKGLNKERKAEGLIYIVL